jgi:hypothetical protein
MLGDVFATFSLHRELSDMILGDKPLLYQSKIGVKHTLKHLKITTMLSVRNN